MNEFLDRLRAAITQKPSRGSSVASDSTTAGASSQAQPASRLQRILHPHNPDGMVTRVRAVLIGILAAGLGMAIGHLVASFKRASASPVLAIGNAVIDQTPTPLKDFAIKQFGTYDKLVLLVSVSIGALVLAGLAGLLARKIFLAGLGLELLLVAIAGGAAMARPAAVGSDIVPTIATAVVGTLTFFGFFWLSGEKTTNDLVNRVLPAKEEGRRGRFTAPRRVFLAGAGAVAGVAVVSAAVGQQLGAVKSTAKLALPTAKEKADAIPAGLSTQYPAITPLRTPNAKFYRVDTALSIPDIDRDTWKLEIDGGANGKKLSFSYDDIAQMDLVERNISLTCISNQPGGSYAGGATWLGVRTRDLLEMAGVTEAGNRKQLFSESAEGFSISTPLGAMLDDRDALLAIGMNGAALPRAHGFPARLVTPGLYGMLGCTKWVTKMTVTDYGSKEAYWTKRGWTEDGPIKPSARIDTPKNFSDAQKAPDGKTIIGGVAWAQRQGVVKVQVSIDEGAWRDATMGPDVGVDYWRQWVYLWDSKATGQHQVRARIVYGDDNKLQSTTRKDVFPDGSSGIVNLFFNN